MPRPTYSGIGVRLEWALRTARRCQRSIALAARAPWLHRAPSRRSAYVERIELLERIGEEFPSDTKAGAVLAPGWLQVLEYRGHCRISRLEDRPHQWLASPYLLHSLWYYWLKEALGVPLATVCKMFVKPDGKQIDPHYLNNHSGRAPMLDLHTEKLLCRYFKMRDDTPKTHPIG